MAKQFFFYRDEHVDAALVELKRRLRPQMDAIGVSDVTSKPLLKLAIREAAQNIATINWVQYIHAYMDASNGFRRSATYLDEDTMRDLKLIQKHIRANAEATATKRGKKAPIMLAAYIAIRWSGESREAVG